VRVLQKRYPFSYYLLGAIVSITLVIAFGIITISYINTERNLESSAKVLQSQTEEDIVNAILIVDHGLKIFDESLNQQAEYDLRLFFEAYEQSGRDPSRIDLQSLKQQINKTQEADLYIINESGIIEFTTYEPDMGMDFKTVPYFYEYLNTIRLSKGFFPDRVVRERTTGKYRKFAYMPTPDHHYILEVGIAEDITRMRDLLAYQETIQNTAHLNPYVSSIRIFDSIGHLLHDPNFVPNEDLKPVLDEIFRERRGMEISHPEEGTATRYLFIDLKEENYGSDVSRVIEITYNTALIRQSLNQVMIFHLLVAIIALILSSGFAIIASRQLTRPIQEIVRDVDVIAEGNLNHAITPTMGSEFAALEQSITKMVGTLKENLSELEQSRKTIQQSNALLNSIFESPNEVVIFALDRDYRYTAFNQNHKRTMRAIWGADIAIGANMLEYIRDPADRDKAKRNFDRALSGEHFSVTEAYGDESLTRRYYEDNYDPIQDEHGSIAGLTVYLTDITKRVQAEEEIRRLNESLEQRVAERTVQLETANKELESFSYTVSHDLRAPLRAIDGFSHILQNQYSSHLPEEAQRYISKVRQNTQQMSDLINDLLNFSRTGRQSLNKQTVLPAELVKMSLEELRTEQEVRQVKVTISDLPPCQADPAMLRQVFYNLISNALKFTRAHEVAEIEVGAYREGNATVYYIRDNGVGFDMRYSDKLFGVFQRLHGAQEYEGTGVGLAIVKRIIQRHGGRIWVESELDRGATFFFTLK
jgi:PAS domain S-box-containing protein